MSIVKKHFKKIVSLMVLVLITSGISLSTAKATSVDFNSKEFQDKQQVVAQTLKLENGTYQIDEELAQGKLTKTEINNINTFFTNVDSKVLDELVKILNPSNSEVSTKALPVVVVAFLGALAAFVGWELASNITADFYRWGVKSGCKKWKKVKVVKSFCKANDYL
ncbi:hypothetical protein [Bacillus sp. NPDC093026]|uniref:hypothetical protein n=1 Tax=Bacillus sp. NPDC093026 TaxID=3363948 RepID=UPI0038219E84